MLGLDPPLPPESRLRARVGDSLDQFAKLADKALRTNRSDVYLRAAEMGWRIGVLKRREVEALRRLIARAEGPVTVPAAGAGAVTIPEGA